MPYCGSQTLVKYYRGSIRKARILHCRSWKCETCAPGRAKRLMAETCGGNPNTFLTLTIRRDMAETPEIAIKRLNDAWVRLRKMIKHRYGIEKMPNMTIVERHKSGWPHLHIFLRSPFIPFWWIRAAMVIILNSPHVHIKRIDNKGRAAAYAAKYCTKCNEKIGTAKRYYKSQNYEQRPPPKGRKDEALCYAHSIEATEIRYLAEAWQVIGFTLTWLSHDCLYAERPP